MRDRGHSVGLNPKHAGGHHRATCDDPECREHGDAMFCERCERWVLDEDAECPAAEEDV